MKKRLISAAAAIALFVSLIPIFPQSAAADNTDATGLTNIELGQYIYLGVYNGELILWRCVAFEKGTRQSDGSILIDSTDTSTSYKAVGSAEGSTGYLPLMISDKIITLKAFDAAGTVETGSHKYDSACLTDGSGFWGDSNLREWLNGTYAANDHTAASKWPCGNAPTTANCMGYNGYDTEKGFLHSDNFNSLATAAIATVKQKTHLCSYAGKHDGGTMDLDESSFITDADITTTTGWATANYANYSYNYYTDRMFCLDVKQLDNLHVNAVNNGWTAASGSNYYYGTPTAKAVSKSTFTSSALAAGINCNYWLRSPYYKMSCSVRYIVSSGQVEKGTPYAGLIGVRPAFFLNLASSADDTGGFHPTEGDGSISKPYRIKTTPGYTGPEAASGDIVKGTSTALVSAGSVSSTGCTMQYKVVSVADDGSETTKSDWSETVPTAASLSAGNYKVYWRVRGDDLIYGDVQDDTKQYFAVEVIKPKPTYTAPSAVSGLVYDTSAQGLTNGGSVSTSGCSLTYVLQSGTGITTDAPDKTAFTSSEAPTGTNAGSYRVWWYIAETSGTSAVGPTAIDVTIAQAVPVVTEPTASAVTYGDALSKSTLSGTGWSWVDGTTVPTVTNSGYEAQISVDDDNYNYTGVSGYDAAKHTVTRTIAVTVSKADPTYTAPTNLTATYGDTLADVTLPSGFTWQDAATTSVGSAGSNTFKVTYTPSDTANYNTIKDIEVTISVGKASPAALTEPTASAVTYGDALSKSTLSDSKWSWSDGTVIPTVTNSGYDAEITVDDSNYDYTSVSGYNSSTHKVVRTIAVTVNKADPSYTAPTNLTAAYGKTLADVTLPSGFSWQDATTTSVGSAGSNTFKVTYTPTDTANYNTIKDIDVTVTVTKSGASVTEPTTSKVTYGVKLGDISLLGGWSWVDDTIVPTVSNSGYDAEISVDDANYDYSSVSGYNSSTHKVVRTLALTVEKADPTYTTPTGLTATYGDTLADVMLPSAGASDTPGAFSWQDATTTSVGNAGSNTFKVTYTPTDTANYNSIKDIEVTVTVAKATPTVTEPTASAVTYGVTLSSITLGGGWSWADDTVKPTVTNSGYDAEISVDDDNYDYTGVSGYDSSTHKVVRTIDVTVSKADPTYSVPTNLTATYGDTLGSVTLPSGFSWQDADTTSVGNVGGNTFKVTYTPSDTANYNTITDIDVTVNVSKSGVSVTEPSASAITYGDELSKSTLSDSKWSWVDGTVKPNAGSSVMCKAQVSVDDTNYDYTGVLGYDSANHIVVREIAVTVNKATPAAVTEPTASAVTYGVTLSSITLGGGWSWVDDTVKPTVTNSGYDAEISVDDDNYDYTGVQGYDSSTHKVVRTIDVTVSKADPTYTVPTNLTATYGDTLADVTLPSGFSWQDADTTSVGNVGGNTFKVTYTPTDTANYNTITDIEVTVNVSKSGVNVTEPTASAITYGDELSNSTLSDSKWSWVDGTVKPNAGSSVMCKAQVSVDDTNYDYTGVLGYDSAAHIVVREIAVTVNKATPAAVTEPTASAVTYGVTLSSITLGGGWSWADDTVKPTVTNSGYDAEISVDDDNYDYTGVQGYDSSTHKVVRTIDVTVSKADPTYTTPSVSGTYGEKLSAIALTSADAGTWEWENPDDVVTASGSYKAKFTPSDTDNYNVVTGIDVTVSVGKATVQYTAPSANTLTYNEGAQALATAGSINGGNSESKIQYVLGNTSADSAPTNGWSETVPTKTDAGDYRVWWRIQDTANYIGVTASKIDVSIAKANPSYTTPTGLTAAFGQTLADVILPTAGASDTPGAFTWQDADTTSVGAVGTNTFKVTYTPSDTANYNTVTDISVSVSVSTAGAAHTPPAELSLTYNGSAQTLVTAGSNDGDGVMEYMVTDTGTTTEQSSGWSQALPEETDAGDYRVWYRVPATAGYTKIGAYYVDVTIAKATPDVSAPENITATYGDTLADVKLPSGFSWQDAAATSVGSVGSRTFKASYTPSDTANYNSIKDIDVTVTVAKATPAAVTVPTAATVTYGVTLSSISLGDDWSWVDGTVIPTVINSGYKAQITVDDDNYDYTSVNGYNSANHTVERTIALTVEKADPAYTLPTGLTATYGDKLGSVTLPSAADGTWVWNNPTMLILTTGNSTYKATYTPNDTDNYNILNDIDVNVGVGTSREQTPNITVNYTSCELEGFESGAQYNIGGVTVTVTGTTYALNKALICGGGSVDIYRLARDANYTDSQTQTVTVTAQGHSYSDWDVTAPTTTSAGSRTRTCTRCGRSETETIPKLPDSLDDGESDGNWTVSVVEATCTDDGKKTYASNNGYGSFDVTIEKLGHDYSTAWSSDASGHWHTCARCGAKDGVTAHTEVEDAAVEATCVSQGKTSGRHCSECGYVTAAQSVTAVDSNNHSYGAWSVTVPPTESQMGSVQRVCSYDTSHTQTYSIPFVTSEGLTTTLPYIKSSAVTKVPTCLDKGTLRITFTDDTFVSVELPEKGHDWGDWNIVTAPSTTSEGLSERVCKNDASHKEQQTIPKLSDGGSASAPDGWTVSITPADCENDGKIVYTSETDGSTVEVPLSATGHDWGDWTVVTEPTTSAEGERARTCTRCGGTESEAIERLPVSEGYSITYEVNEGAINGSYPTSYTDGESAALPTDVTRDGYVFMGWYENAEFTGKAVTEIAAGDTGDKTYYAKWLQKYNEYTIILDEHKKMVIGVAEPGYILVNLDGSLIINGSPVTIRYVSDDGREDNVEFTPPTAVENLVYTGAAQKLVSEGKTEGCEIEYKLGEDGVYSTEIPEAVDVGEYTVYYRVIVDSDYDNAAEASVSVKISNNDFEDFIEIVSVGETSDTGVPNAVNVRFGLHEDTDGTLIGALYNEDGKLVEITSEEVHITSGSICDKWLAFTAAGKKEYTVKVFLWDSISGMRPIIGKYAAAVWPNEEYIKILSKKDNTAEVEFKTSDSYENAVLIGTLYDGDMLAETVTRETGAIIAGNNYTMWVEFENSTQDCTVKAFLWESLGKMKPCIESYAELAA